MDVKKFVDVSSFFLFEASGDSEADSRLLGVNNSDDDSDDDAESWCCSDVGEISEVSDKVFRDYRCEKDDVDDEEDENGEVVEQEGLEFQKRRRRGDQRIGSAVERESTGSIDSRKTRKEREKSRAFWETCLAS